MAPQRRKKPVSKAKPESKVETISKPLQQTSLVKQVLRVVIGNILVTILATAYLYYSQQRSQPVLTRTETGIYTVVDLPGRGKGIIAARDIKQSELILTERPLFSVPVRISSSPTALVSSKIETLSTAQREAFFNLSYVNFPSNLNPDEHPDEVALAIFQTNAVSVGKNAAIFPNMARLNHGCSSAFNVVYMWRENRGLLYIHALKDIPKGKELLTTYTTSRKPRAERRAYLNQQYGFHCTCESREEIDGREAMDHIRKIWQLEEEEGYWSERGQLAADATWIAAAHEDAAATQSWARLALEWYSSEIGNDAPQVDVMRAVGARPQKHKAWGTRTPLEVGGPVT